MSGYELSSIKIYQYNIVTGIYHYNTVTGNYHYNTVTGIYHSIARFS